MSGINLSPGEIEPGRFNQAIRQMMQGRDNAGGTVTLTANAATTTVSAPNCATGCGVFLQASTASAATEVGNGTIYISAVVNGSFTITHANSAVADRSFFWTARG